MSTRYTNAQCRRDLAARRRSELAAIHVLKTQAAMSEDEYREMLRAVTGKSSAGDLDERQRSRVFDHFAKLGVKSTGRMRRERVGGDRRQMLAKIDALLSAAGRDRVYLDSLVKRIARVDALEFCDPLRLQKLIVALTIDADRHGRSYPR